MEVLVHSFPSGGLPEINSFLISPLLASPPLDFVNGRWPNLVCLDAPPFPARCSCTPTGYGGGVRRELMGDRETQLPPHPLLAFSSLPPKLILYPLGMASRFLMGAEPLPSLYFKQTQLELPKSWGGSRGSRAAYLRQVAPRWQETVCL